MNGYFSRLIQQTGIALETGQVSEGRNFQDAIVPQISNEIVPMQIEETQEIRKQETQTNELKVTRRVENENLVASQFSTQQDAENENFIPLPQVERESFSPRGETPRTIIKEQPIESLSAQATPSQNALDTENFPKVPQYYHQVESEQVRENRTNNVVIKKTISPETSLFSEHLQKGDTSKELPSEKPTLPDRQPNEIPKQNNLPPTRQINLQTVLEWVAETPEKNPKSQIPNPKSQIPNPNSQIPNPNSQIPNPNSQIPNPNSQFPNLNSQFPNYPAQKTQNFVLSIGTISLTVEAPQPEVKKPPLPMKSQQEVKPASQTSRLSRHYIR
jgi:hypothetical protein